MLTHTPGTATYHLDSILYVLQWLVSMTTMVIDRLRKFYRDLSLKKKFIYCLLLLLGFTGIGYSVSVFAIRRASDRLLYASTRGTIVYSASTLSQRLLSLQNMSNIILSDSDIQHNLSITDDPDASYIDRSNAFNALGSSIPEYYNNFKDGTGMQYISLYNDSYVTRSNYVHSTDLSAETVDRLLEAAHQAQGAPVWVTDDCQEEGLFLCRDIRRAANLELDTIGTLLINIDLEQLIQNVSSKMDLDGSMQFILYRDGEEIFHTESFPQNELHSLGEDDRIFMNDYGVIQLAGTYYFYIRDALPDLGWQFLALLPYTSVVNTQRVSTILCIAILIPVMFLCLLLFCRMVNVIVGHLTELIHKMDQFGADETQLPQCTFDYSERRDEIGELHRRFDMMAVHVQDLIRKNYVNELLAKEAQFKFLESQINPHFLYNTLESINWRAMALGDEDISSMVEALGALLRVTLSKKDTPSTLGSELDIVNNYMTIIHLRYDERIVFCNEIPESLYSLSLPQLTLQPLIENAINYALEEMAETCTIRLCVCPSDEELVLKISNTGSQFPEDLLHKLSNAEIMPHGFGIGLLNVQNRLQLQFGPEYGLELVNDELQDLAIVYIHLPLM